MLQYQFTALIDSVCLIGRSAVAMVVNSAGTYSASSYRNDDRQLLDIHSSSCELTPGASDHVSAGNILNTLPSLAIYFQHVSVKYILDLLNI